VPNEVSSFLGRREEIDRVASAVRNARLVTLTGAGGIGKTRLALRVVKEFSAGRGRNAWVTLSSAVDDVRVANTLARALGTRDLETIDASISDATDDGLLLVLDGCEHVIGACAAFVDRLLQSNAAVRVLATSREPLGVPGETVIPVAPLPVPEPAAPLDRQMENAAVELFVERARARVPDFELSPETAEIVAGICRSLDGIPLAIELAAARITTMTIADIAQGLVDPIGLLTGGGRAAPPRHQTFRASLDWSYSLLQAPERRLLRRLAIFSAGFTVEAAVSVCAADDLPADQIAFHLERLHAQSLVQTSRQGGTIRFALFEAVRRYAGELLRESGEEGSIRDRHLRWCLSLAHRLARVSVESEQLRRLEFDEGNIRSALCWTLDSSRANERSQLALGLGRLWQLRGRTGGVCAPPCGESASEAMEILSVNSTLSVAAAQDILCDQSEVCFDPDGPDSNVESPTPAHNLSPVEAQSAASTPEAGSILTVDSPIDALSQATAQRGKGPRLTVLSERELSVARLVARGQSNREIAEALVISRKTADAHVSHILTKLGLWRRVQIATWTLQHCAGVAAVD
jgi:non-specific serine/threonine protein kinase